MALWDSSGGTGYACTLYTPSQGRAQRRLNNITSFINRKLKSSLVSEMLNMVSVIAKINGNDELLQELFCPSLTVNIGSPVYPKIPRSVFLNWEELNRHKVKR